MQLEFNTGIIEEDMRAKRKIQLESEEGIYIATINALVTQLGLEKVFDQYGCWIGCQLEDNDNKMTLRIEFEESPNRRYYAQKVKIKDITFWKEGELLTLGDVPKRFISLCQYIQSKLEKNSDN